MFFHFLKDKCIRPLAIWFIFVMMDSLLTKAIILCAIWILMAKDKLAAGLCNRTDRIAFGKALHLEQHPDESNHHQLGLFCNTHDS